jgi:hypothetical protein
MVSVVLGLVLSLRALKQKIDSTQPTDLSELEQRITALEDEARADGIV